jgi:hypothetical protein
MACDSSSLLVRSDKRPSGQSVSSFKLHCRESMDRRLHTGKLAIYRGRLVLTTL